MSVFCSFTVEESSAPSMTGSSVIMMPAAAPSSVHHAADSDDEDAVHVTREDMPLLSPSTMRSTSPTEWSETSGSSLWEDARPSVPAARAASLHRHPSAEFVFIDDEDAEESERHF